MREKMILAIILLGMIQSVAFADLASAKSIKKVSKQATSKLKKRVLSDKEVKNIISKFLNHTDKKVKETAKLGYTYEVKVKLNHHATRELFAKFKPLSFIEKQLVMDTIIKKIKAKGYKVEVIEKTTILEIWVAW